MTPFKNQPRSHIVIMLFKNAGAFAALLLFSRGALGAAINATATDDTCEPDETITATIVASPSGAPLPVNGTVSNPGPSFNGTLGAAGAQQQQQQPSGAPAGSVVTEVVYSTNIHTVTSCAASITDCPARSSALSTEVVAVTQTRTLPSGIPTGAGGVGPSGAGAAPPSGRPSGSGLPPLSAAEAVTGAPSGTGAPGGPRPSGVPSGIPSGIPSGAPLGGPSGVPSGAGPLTGQPSGSVVPIASGAVGAQAVNASSAAPVEVVTETFYSTSMHTVLSCAPTVTDCPLRNQSISTHFIPTATAVVTRTLSTGIAVGAASVTGAPAPFANSSVAALTAAPSPSSAPVELITETSKCHFLSGGPPTPPFFFFFFIKKSD